MWNGRNGEVAVIRSGLYSGPHLEVALDTLTSLRRTSYTCLDAGYPIIMIVSLELVFLNTDRPLLQPTLDRTRMAWVTQ